jgi:lipid A 3-O-deacylase
MCAARPRRMILPGTGSPDSGTPNGVFEKLTVKVNKHSGNNQMMKNGTAKAPAGAGRLGLPVARAARLLLALGVAGLMPPAAAQAVQDRPATQSALVPSSVFLQGGVAEEAQMAIIGATWDWSWYRDFSVGRLGGYWEASIGRWNSDVDDQGGSAWVTQLGVTPVLRLYPHSWGGRWFVEGGIGFNFLQPIYRSASKRFSTAFNFGDHLAVGRRFGSGGRHEVALRFQHFSNAGIKAPNPGENFLQLRYSRYF